MTRSDASRCTRTRWRVQKAQSGGNGLGPSGDLTASHARGRRFKSCAAHHSERRAGCNPLALKVGGFNDWHRPSAYSPPNPGPRIGSVP